MRRSLAPTFISFKLSAMQVLYRKLLIAANMITVRVGGD